MAQITTYFTSSGGGISGSGAAGEVAFFTAATVLDSSSRLEWDDTNRRLSLNGPNTVGSTLTIAGDGKTDATSAIDVRTSLLNGDITVFKVYDNGRIDSQVLSNTGTGGLENVALGTSAGGNITIGTKNTFLGSLAGRDMTTADCSTLIGRGAGRGITSSPNNTCIGEDSGAALTSGPGFNTFSGCSSGNSNTTGRDNSCHGFESMKYNTSGSYNTCGGVRSLGSNKTGSYNYAGGYEAGKPKPGETDLNSSNSIYIGAGCGTGSSTTTVTNEIVIGSNAVGAGDNTSTIGHTTCNRCIIRGSIEPTGNIVVADAKNIVLSTGTGTQIGTSASQKLAFWGDTPVVQPATGNITPAARTPVSSTAIHTDDTFGGYTVAQVVGALQQIGILA